MNMRLSKLGGATSPSDQEIDPRKLHVLHTSQGRSGSEPDARSFDSTGGGYARRRKALRILLSLLLILGIPFGGSVAHSQVTTAAVNGLVKDSSGALVPGADILATQTATNYTAQTTTGDNGEFSLPILPVGPYTIRVSRAGFESFEQSGILLQVGQARTLQIALKVGAGTETVTVTSELPAVDSSSNTIQAVVGEKVVTGLPLNGRNPADLLYTIPGVTNAVLNGAGTQSTVKEADATPPNESAPTVSGVRPGGTYFSLDGASNVDPWNVIGGPFPNPDATQEFGVVTGTYGARYVSAPGGAVNIITKSGTNAFHGTVFEFLRNGDVNARNYFQTTPDILKRNQYGFAAGGPILKNKLFIFGSLQATPVTDSAPLVTTTPTAAERSGQFISAINGETVTIPGPPSTVTQNLFKYIPLPGSDGFYRTTLPADNNDFQWVLRGDYTIGSHRIFGRFFEDRYTTPTVPLTNNDILTQSGGSNHSWDSLAFGDTWASKSGNWISEARLSYLKVPVTNDAVPGNEALSYTALGATGFTAGVIPGLGITVANGVYASPSQTEFPRHSWNFNEDVIHTTGRHQLSFGTDLQWLTFSESNLAGQNGVAIFAGLYSLIVAGPLTDNTNADLYAGHPLIFIQGDGFFTASHGHTLGFYGEDKYKASDRLTLTAGLRWDPYLPYTLQAGHVNCWNPGQQSSVFVNAPLGVIYPGDPGCSGGGTSSKFPIIQPRVGFAYQLDDKGATAVRGGYGLYSQQFQIQSFLGFSSFPWVRQYQLVNPFQSIDNIWGSNGQSDPFVDGFTNASYMPPHDVSYEQAESIGLKLGAIGKDFRPAYVHQYSLSLQHAFTSADSVELAYVGTLGVNISQSYDVNAPIYIPGTSTGAAGSCGSLSGTNLPPVGQPCSSTSNENARRPYGASGLTQINEMHSNSTSNYNGLNVTYHHQRRGGLDFTSAFNWSKCIDEGSQPAGTNAPTANDDNPTIRRGRCDFDQNLTFRNIGVWSTPKLENAERLVRAIAGSWSLSGIFTWDAGQPFSVTSTLDNSYTNIGLDLADSVPNVPRYVNGKLNAAAFTVNAAGTYGNSGRNSLRSPGYVDVDTGIMKFFPVYKDRVSGVFRTEAFNLFNHPSFFPPNASLPVNTTTFGVSTAARAPRILQFSVKLMF
jgi:hypothetical protein